jgi:hypothetical protein
VQTEQEDEGSEESDEDWDWALLQSIQNFMKVL